MNGDSTTPEMLGRGAASPVGQAPPPGLAGMLLQRLAAKCAGWPMAFDLVLPDGATQRLGNGARAFSLVLRNGRALRAFASLDQARVAEAFFDGDFDIQGDMLSALQLRRVLPDRRWPMIVRRFVQPLLLGQVRLNKRAISSHYDRDPSLFLQFLDPDLPLYTHGLYERDDEPLADACLRKFAYCFERCRLKPGDHVLEVGPGWGAWFEYVKRLALMGSRARTHRPDPAHARCDYQRRLAHVA